MESGRGGNQMIPRKCDKDGRGVATSDLSLNGKEIVLVKPQQQ